MTGTALWFEEYSDRFRDELGGLENAGIKYEIDQEAKRIGVLMLNLVIPVNNKLGIKIEGELKIRVEYPDNYPYFRPEVYAEDLELPRHQNLREKNLCLLKRDSGSWNVEWTIAEFLKHQLPKVLEKGNITDPTVIGNDPDEQGEPASEYFRHQSNYVIVGDIAVIKPPENPTDEIVKGGEFYFGLRGNPKEFNWENSNEGFIQFIVSKWTDTIGKTITSLNGALLNGLSTTYRGSWYWVSKMPARQDEQYTLFVKVLENAKFDSTGAAIKIKKGAITKVVGIIFPEEITRGKAGLGCVFLIVNQNRWQWPVSIMRVGEQDYMERIPKLAALRKHTIAIVGLGSLGAPSAIEFAKNGIGRLKLLDYDVVEPGPSVRWPLGFTYAGMGKANALKQFIGENFPYTEVEVFHRKIGGTRRMTGAEKSEREFIKEYLDGVTLIYDATAEEGVSHLFSHEAERRKIPFISIEGRMGAWGGLVVRVVPGKTAGCWSCVKSAMEHNRISRPFQDLKAEIQPKGCGDLTFTGASFDLQNISLAGVRLAASTLCNTVDGYDDLGWDIGILSLVDGKNGYMAVAPEWCTYPLNRDPNCPYCGEEQAHMA